jgi:hypothetical protein
MEILHSEQTRPDCWSTQTAPARDPCEHEDERSCPRDSLAKTAFCAMSETPCHSGG